MRKVLKAVSLTLLVYFVAPAVYAQSESTHPRSDFKVFTNTTTNDMVAKFLNGAPIDSAIYESGGKVGIGTTAPDSGLGTSQEGLLRIVSTNDKNSMLIVQNGVSGVNAAAVFRTQADGSAMSFQSHSTGRLVGRFGVTLGGWNEMLSASGNGLAIGTSGAAPLIFGTNTTDRLHILPNGNVGLSISNPNSLLQLYPNATAGFNVKLYDYSALGTTWAAWNTVLGWNAGAAQTTANDVVTLVDSLPNNPFGADAIRMSNDGVAIHTVPGPTMAGTVVNSPRLVIDPYGNVNFPTPVTGTFTIGLPPAAGQDGVNVTINGKLTARQVIGAVYQDVAEWVPATTHMKPGTVVVLNREHDNEVMPSARAYDTAVAGVVSEAPGVILGIAGDSKAQIATTGRVKVKVDATKSSVAIGDLLVSGEKPGTAIKSQPIDVGGVAIHRPGTVIGKALQPLANGEGEILVLLSLQ